MNAKERESYWREVVGRQKNSGLSVRAFCGEENICAHSLYIWRQRLAQKRPVSFAEVRVRHEQSEASRMLTLVLPGGEQLGIAAGVHATTLRTVLAVLRERA
jgi:hypothetical protein